MAVPPGVRPTEARVREALFSIWRERLPGARFLDLFAGSGVVGFEALSRRAAEAHAVESSRRIAGVARASAIRLAVDGWQLTRAELPGALESFPDDGFELAFADPPYDFTGYEALIGAVSRVLASDGAVAVEHSVRVSLPAAASALAVADQRVYGESALTLYRAAVG